MPEQITSKSINSTPSRCSIFMKPEISSRGNTLQKNVFSDCNLRLTTTMATLVLINGFLLLIQTDKPIILSFCFVCELGFHLLLYWKITNNRKFALLRVKNYYIDTLHIFTNCGSILLYQTLCVKRATVWTWTLMKLLLLVFTNDMLQNFFAFFVESVVMVFTMLVIGGFTILEVGSVIFCVIMFLLLINFHYTTLSHLKNVLRQKEIEIRDQNLRNKALVETLSDRLIKVSAKDYSIIDINTDFFERPKASLLHTNIIDMFSCDVDAQRVIKTHLDMVIETKKHAEWNFRLKPHDHTDYKEKWINVKASPILNEEGVEEVTLLCSDISEKRKAQENFELAQKAEISSKLKSDFIAEITHEIRNPLQAILYSLSLLNMSLMDQVS